jgi:ribonucleotide monophosphatase NagD (HAD superfamily)
LTGNPDTLVLGGVGEALDYAALNSAFRILTGGGEFIALAQNRAFRDSDGELSLDAGAFIAALEYASGVKGARIGQASGSVFQCGFG